MSGRDDIIGKTLELGEEVLRTAVGFVGRRKVKLTLEYHPNDKYTYSVLCKSGYLRCREYFCTKLEAEEYFNEEVRRYYLSSTR